MAGVLAVSIAGLAAVLRICYTPFYYAKISVVKTFWIASLPVRAPIWLVMGMASAAFAFDSPSSYLVTALLIGAITGLILHGVMTAFSVTVEQLTSYESSHSTGVKSGNGLELSPTADSDYDSRGKPFDKPSRRQFRQQSR